MVNEGSANHHSSDQKRREVMIKFIQMYGCMHLCMYSCMHAACVHVCMCSCMHVCMYVCMYASNYIYIHICVYIYNVCVCVCVCAYIYIHTQTLNRFSMSLRFQWWDDFPHISTRLCTTASALENYWIMGDPNLRTGNCTGCGRSPIFKKYPSTYIYIYVCDL